MSARVQPRALAQPQAHPEAAAQAKLPAYFYRLSAADQKRYLASDGVQGFRLTVTPDIRAKAENLRAALATQRLGTITQASQRLVDALCYALGVGPPMVEVRGVRPRNQRGELHGIFYPRPRSPYIVLWARTAKRHDLVAPKTFLRTLIHELVHHLDYALLKLGTSFHTSGFFQRESFLVRALLLVENGKAAPAVTPAQSASITRRAKAT
jgi:hypothetical protein